MFDPNIPANNSPNSSAQMRGQLTSLKALIDAIQSIIAAQVDGVTTLPPGDPAAVTITVNGTTMHFTFAIPRGNDGGQGSAGTNGTNGIDGAPGEVTSAQLATAISGTSNNTNAVALLGLTVSDPPTQSEMQAIANKLDEFILAGRR